MSLPEEYRIRDLVALIDGMGLLPRLVSFSVSSDVISVGLAPSVVASGMTGEHPGERSGSPTSSPPSVAHELGIVETSKPLSDLLTDNLPGVCIPSLIRKAESR